MTVKLENVDQLKTSNSRLRAQNKRLHHKLEEMQQLLNAIEEGAVDAFVVERDKEPQVFTLQGAERPFRTVVETMNEGAATIAQNGLILYCNQRFAEIVRRPLTDILGTNMLDFVRGEQARIFEQMTRDLRTHNARGELALTAADGREVAVYAALSPLEDSEAPSMCLVITDISDLKRKNKELLEEALTAGRVIAFEWDPSTDKVTRSENASEMYGFDSSIGIGRQYFALIHPEDHDRLINILNSLTPQNSQYRHQYRLILPDGRLKWVEDIAQGDFDNGRLVRVHGLNIDITERKYTEEDLRRAQSVAHVGSWLMNVKTNELKWSEETHRIFEVPPGTALSYQSFIEVVHPDDRNAVNRAWQTAMLSRSDYNVQHRIIVGGKVKWVHEVSELEFDMDGSLLGAFGTCQDITELKEAEQQLVQRTAEAEESQRLLDAIMEHVPVGITVVTLPDTTIRLMSRFGAERINGGKREHFEKTKDWVNWRLTLPDGEPVPMDQMPLYKAVYENQGVQSQEYLIDTEKGQTLHLLISAGPIRDSEHNTIGGIAIWQDITELKAAERRLQQRTAEAEEWAHLLDLIMEHIPVGIMLADAPDVRIRLISRFGAFLLNKGKRSDFEGFLLGDQKQIWNLLSPGMVPVGTDLLPLRQAILKGQTSENQEYVLVRKGENIHLFISAGPIRNKQDEIIGGILVWQDITELKRAEQSLQHSRQNLLHLKEQLENKNKELESVLAIVSHDLRSPLVSISGFSQEIRLSCRNAENIVRQMQWPGDQALPLLKTLTQEIPESIEFIQTSSNRMDTLVRSLVKVARAGIAEIRPERLNMNELVAEASDSIGFEIKEAQTDLRIEDLPECFADRAQASQIFSNLLDNAIKYLDPNRPGRIRVSGSVEQTQSVYCVEDNGIGISPEYQDKIFELFLRIDRNRTAGEGIGLAMVKRLVARNNGSIWVESVSGEGSKFYVSLPRSEPI